MKSYNMCDYKRDKKVFYNLKGIIRTIIPRIFAQKNLDSKIQNIFRIYDNKLEYLAMRLSLYNKLQEPFMLPQNREELPSDSDFLGVKPPYPSRLCNMQIIRPLLDMLKNNTLMARYATVYYYDSYEWSRYFDDNLTWAFIFGDVNTLVSCPAIVKSRPIMQENTNSVLLQLEKWRHFNFIRDSIPYENKKDILFFRGAIYQDHRIRFFTKHFDNPLCDIGHVGNSSDSIDSKWTKPAASLQDHLRYKFLLSLEGFDVATNLKWILSSNSLCIMPKPEMETWFMESGLQNGIHYAEIHNDYSNLDEVIDFYKNNPHKAREIIANANAYCRQFFDRKLEGALNLLVLRKYFYLSRQIDVSEQEKELFAYRM